MTDLTIPRVGAVALAVQRQRPESDSVEVLAVLRPHEPGEELPGLWGLPAANLSLDESEEEALHRLAERKLGTSLLSQAVLIARGQQRRPAYTLEMALFSAPLHREPRLPDLSDRVPGVTYYTAWRWASPEDLIPAADRGSLCTRLFLNSLGWRYFGFDMEDQTT